MTLAKPNLFARALLLALVLTVPTAALADPVAQDDSAARIAQLNEAGAKAYAERNYRAAIERFVEAYAIDHDPNLLFNIARSYEKLGDLAAAVEKYEAFIKAPGADTDGRIKAKTSLRELRELQAQTSPEDDGERAPTASDSAPPPAAETASPRLWPWVVLGAGAVATGVGATFYALGMADHDKVTSAPGYDDRSAVHPLTRAQAQAYVDSGNTKKLVGGIGLGLGGALVATSVVLFVSGSATASTQSERAVLDVTPTVGGLVASYRGSF
jgi:tetratricopeptide (TPR) repeat protein